VVGWAMRAARHGNFSVSRAPAHGLPCRAGLYGPPMSANHRASGRDRQLAMTPKTLGHNPFYVLLCCTFSV
jgi:hypothetical protein